MKPIKMLKRGIPDEKLNPKQLSFVQAFFGEANLNWTEAAKISLKSKNPSQAAYAMMKSKKVMTAISKRMHDRAVNSELTIEYLDKRTLNVLELDPYIFFEKDEFGTYFTRDLGKVPPEVRKCISKFKVRAFTTQEGTDTRIEVELMSKDAAHAIGYRRLGALQDKVKLDLGVDQESLKAVSRMLQTLDPTNIIDAAVIERRALEPPKEA